MLDLLHTLGSVGNELRPLASSSVLLLTPALSEKRFKAERPEQAALWDLYYNECVLPVAAALHCLTESADARIVWDATYGHLQKAMLCPSVSAVFLVAHHIEGAGDGTSAIQFSDSDCPMPEIVSAYKEALQSRGKFCFAPLVCNSEVLTEELTAEIASSGLNGLMSDRIWTNWAVPMVETVELACEWIIRLDGKKTLGEAMESSVVHLLDRWQTGSEHV